MGTAASAAKYERVWLFHGTDEATVPKPLISARQQPVLAALCALLTLEHAARVCSVAGVVAGDAWRVVSGDDSGAVQVVAINYKDKPAAALRGLTELGNPYARIGVDENGRVAIDWGVYGVPETYLVDAAGQIRYRHVGPLTAAVVRGELLPRLAALR